MPLLLRTSVCLLIVLPSCCAQEAHDHGVPEKLGTVTFPVSCTPAVQDSFNRGVALLHSFAYSAARQAFQQIAERDPRCAMAHWGVAITYFHQLWDPPLSSATTATAQKEIELAEPIGAASDRERGFIRSLNLLLKNADSIPYETRALSYETAMRELHFANPKDTEVQVFYALALLSNASPADKTHARQKQAIELLEPLNREFPEHPGIAHYLIHACDNAELATRGLAPARAYARIAPSAPHALHMPSHIFTRLGLWEDSITSNLAARQAALREGDRREELHAMDYLVYAYLQSGRDLEATQVIQELKQMKELGADDFTAAYAATAMPVRYAVERGDWAEAAAIPLPAGAPPHVVAVAVWARGLGLARSGHAAQARAEIDGLRDLAEQLRKSGRAYWAGQVEIQMREVAAWSAQADNKPDEAAALMRAAADQEDATEKLPVTPGPIVPAREQLGQLLLEQKHPSEAWKEFKQALVNSPGRRGAAQGLARAGSQSNPHSPTPGLMRKPPQKTHG